MSTKTVKAQRTEFTMNNEDYRMDRYKSRTVLVFKKINGVYDFVSAKQIIRLKLILKNIPWKKQKIKIQDILEIN